MATKKLRSGAGPRTGAAGSQALLNNLNKIDHIVILMGHSKIAFDYRSKSSIEGNNGDWIGACTPAARAGCCIVPATTHFIPGAKNFGSMTSGSALDLLAASVGSCG